MGMIRTRQIRSGTRFDVRIHRAGLEMTKTFKTVADARKWMHETEARLDRGDILSRRAEKVPFEEAAKAFEEHFNDFKTNDLMLLKVLKEKFKSKTVAQIDHDAIQEFINKMLVTKIAPPKRRKKLHPYYNGAIEKCYSPSTVRKHYFMLKKVMEWHSLREKYSLNPLLFKKLKIPAAWEGKRERRFQEGEETRLIEAVKDGYANVAEWPLLIGFALATAARAQEIIKADWKDFSIENRSWKIPKENVKTKTFRKVPLSKTALQILEEMDKLKSQEDTRVFHVWPHTNSLSKAFRRLAIRADMEDFKFHDLRHEAISRLFEKNKLSDAEIMKITGHTNIQTLLGYTHLREDHLADKLD